MDWEDTTTYSRSDKHRTPSIWTARAGRICIIVHRHIHYPDTQWLLSCTPFFDKHEMDSENVDICKEDALRLVSEKMHEAIEGLSR